MGKDFPFSHAHSHFRLPASCVEMPVQWRFAQDGRACKQGKKTGPVDGSIRWFCNAGDLAQGRQQVDTTDWDV